MADFKIGDVVKLKSGSPIMTITDYSFTSMAQQEPDYFCTWFNDKQELQSFKCKGDALEKATEEEINKGKKSF